MKKLLYTLALMLVLTGCANKEPVNPNTNRGANEQAATEKESSSPVVKQLTVEDYKTLKVNELGDIPVIMYHALVNENPPSVYQITKEQFKKDLQYLYDNKYRIISMKDFVEGNISVAAGYTPVVFTFDDSEPSDFSLVEKDGKLVPTEGCAVDIMQKFAKGHPEFGNTATFFINGGEDAFEGAGTYKERLEYLVNNGYDVGNHTYTHSAMSKLSSDKVKEEIGKVDAEIKAALPNYKIIALSYPLGIRPKEEFRKLAQDGEYNGAKYHYDITFREGPSATYSRFNKNYDLLNAPRLRGNSGEENGQDLWGYLKKYEEKPERRYISDGDANTVVILSSAETNVNKEKLGDKKVVTY